jgi:hypothetical protein
MRISKPFGIAVATLACGAQGRRAGATGGSSSSCLAAREPRYGSTIMLISAPESALNGSRSPSSNRL